jgi:FlaA1/EpsC-like NDP-sugar epimerase
MLATFAGTVLSYLTYLLVTYFGFSAYFDMPDFRGSLSVFALSTLAIEIVRVTVKAMYDYFRNSESDFKVVIYGVRCGAVGIAKMINNQMPQRYHINGFISPDGELSGGYLMGSKVIDVDATTVSYLTENNIRAVLVSPLQTDYFREQEALINELIEAGIKIIMMPHPEEWDGKTEIEQEQLKEVDIEDLLPRDKIEVDMDAIGALLKDKKILITGAAGSIGSEIVRQAAAYHPAEMILIDQAETPSHDLRLLMAKEYAFIKSETIVASITNWPFMEKIFVEHRPDYVFHAAAYKHVPMMENNPAMAVQNNIHGTRIIADLAVKYGTKKFVMISTDKAVNPTNVMGCSKRICEIYCQSLNKAIVEGKVEGVTQFVTTRFGNVLGSNGSVIPLFKEQIRQGGPITVTHPDIIRFFMLIPEACKLVLEAGTMGRGGEIFLFDMGKPVKIVNLAKRMIALSGAKNIDIKFTGLRDGEKLYEEVLFDKENTISTTNPKIKVAKVREYDYTTACANEEELLELSHSFDDMAIVRKMKLIVPEYKSKVSKYEAIDHEIEEAQASAEGGKAMFRALKTFFF